MENTINYINLTKHHVTDTITGLTIEPSGQTARVDNPSKCTGSVGNIPTYGDNPDATVIGLPEPKENTIYIVSNLVLNFVKGRTDVVSTGAPVKCKQTQQITGCKGFRTK